MILTFPTFYRKFGVRQLAQLVSPTLNDYKFLELPSDAAYHHLSFDGVTTGPANDETLFRNIKRPISVENVLELAAFEGGPKRTPVNAAIIARQFFTTHRRMRMMRGIAASASDKNTPLVFNYAILPQLYRYPQTPLTGYYKWRNQYATVVNQIIKVTEETTRQNFVFAEVPNVIPSLTQLNLAANEINTATLRPFQDPDAKLLLELWKWLGADRQSSIFSRIPKNKIHLVNVVFVESGKWSVVNLGMLNSWRKPDADEASDNRKASESGDGYVIVSKQTVNNKQLAMRVLRMFMSVMEARTITLKEELPKDENADILAPAVLQDEEELDDEEQTPSVDSGSTDPVEEVIADVDAPEVELAPDAISDMTDEEFALHIEKEDTALEQDLQLLNDIAKKAHEETASDKGLLSDYLAKLEQATPEQGIETLCDKLAVDGLITPVEARKYVKLATNYKTMKAADGISTLEDFIKIDPASLTLDNVGKMPDNTSVIDKSMLTSSLNVFDEKYITDILHKDYANVMLSVQRAGIAVTQYKVERTEDILGGYEDHTLKISPVIGQPSTLRFKLPIVNPDGTYTTNGVKYRLRKQRGDENLLPQW